MEAIISAAALGIYTTDGITLSKGKYIDNETGKEVAWTGVKLHVRNARVFCAETRPITLFTASNPAFEELYDVLKDYIKEDEDGIVKDRNGDARIDMRKLKKSDDFEYVKNYMTIEGVEPVTVKLRKGLCYRNDKDGNIRKDKNGNNIVADSVTVLAIVEKMTLNSQGGYDKTYVLGFNPETQRDQIENRFFVNPASTGQQNPFAQQQLSSTSAQVPPQAGTTTQPEEQKPAKAEEDF